MFSLGDQQSEQLVTMPDTRFVLYTVRVSMLMISSSKSKGARKISTQGIKVPNYKNKSPLSSTPSHSGTSTPVSSQPLQDQSALASPILAAPAPIPANNIWEQRKSAQQRKTQSQATSQASSPVVRSAAGTPDVSRPASANLSAEKAGSGGSVNVKEVLTLLERDASTASRFELADQKDRPKCKTSSLTTVNC